MKKILLVDDGAIVRRGIRCSISWHEHGFGEILEASDGRQGLELLEEGGIMSLSIYYGKNNGFEERDAILEYLKQLDIRTYSVLVSQFYNRPNCPPISATIFKFTNL